MSRVDLFNGVTIIVESSDKSFHTYDDWGLYITNTDCIGEPEQYTKYIEIPGRSGVLDLSEVLTGRQIYKSRPITIKLSGHDNKTAWDSIISTLRNEINGRVCQIIFDNDKGFYWRGRISINDFESIMSLGMFQIDIPAADPYKYSIESSAEPWLWDPFSFQTGVITYVDAIVVSGTRTVTIPHGYMPTCPEFVVSNKTGTLTVACDGTSYELANGDNKIPSIYVGGDSDVSLTFSGNAKVQIVYRSGSL